MRTSGHAEALWAARTPFTPSWLILKPLACIASAMARIGFHERAWRHLVDGRLLGLMRRQPASPVAANGTIPPRQSPRALQSTLSCPAKISSDSLVFEIVVYL